MADCPICATRFTALQRNEIACPSCQFGACLKCVERFMLQRENIYEPQCMNCHAPWNQDFVDTVLPKTFRYGPLKRLRQQAIWDRERSLLPDTTLLVQRELRIREQQDLIKELTKRKKDLDAELRNVNRTIAQTRTTIVDIKEANIEHGEKRRFVRSCPLETCRGYLSMQWKCELCDVRVCSSCHCVKGEEHACNPDDVASAEALVKETRPCPKCGARIFKIDGCDQMFCTAPTCHTAFSWRTGKVEHGRIHNPHYYEWMRQTRGEVPREPGDNPCGGDHVPNYAPLASHLRGRGLMFVELGQLHRLAVHVQLVELPDLPPPRPAHALHTDLRIKYLLNEISEEFFKKEVFRRQKQMEKHDAYRDLLQMFLNVARDLLSRVAVVTNQDDLNAIRTEALALKKYFNDQSIKVSVRFGYTLYKHMDDRWYMTHARLKKR